MKILFLDPDNNPQSPRIHAALCRALEGVHHLLPYPLEPTKERLNVLNDQCEMLVINHAHWLPEGKSRLHNKVVLRLIRQDAGQQALASKMLPLENDLFMLGVLPLPDDESELVQAFSMLKPFLDQASSWVKRKQQREDALRLAAIYAAAPLMATAF